MQAIRIDLLKQRTTLTSSLFSSFNNRSRCRRVVRRLENCLTPPASHTFRFIASIDKHTPSTRPRTISHKFLPQKTRHNDFSSPNHPRGLDAANATLNKTPLQRPYDPTIRQNIPTHAPTTTLDHSAHHTPPTMPIVQL